MLKTELPSWFDASRLTPVRFYRYRSTVEDRFFEVQVYGDGAKEKYASVVKKFHELKQKCVATPLKVLSDKEPFEEIRKDIWDNKVVVECITELGNTVYVGYKDFTFSLGLGVSGDGWVVPYEYQSFGEVT